MNYKQSIEQAFNAITLKYSESVLDYDISSWELESCCDTSIQLTLPNAGTLALTIEEGMVILDFDNEGSNLQGEYVSLVEDMITSCAEWFEANPTTDLIFALSKIFEISNSILSSFCSGDEVDISYFDGYLEETDENHKTSHEEVNLQRQEEITLRTRLLRKDEERRLSKENGLEPNGGDDVDVLGKQPARKTASVKSIFSDGASAKILTSDLLSLMNESGSLGYTVEAIDDNVHNWRVQINEFDRY